MADTDPNAQTLVGPPVPPSEMKTPNGAVEGSSPSQPQVTQQTQPQPQTQAKPQPQAKPDPKAAPFAGQVWGDFELTRLIGKGGMGSVYLGRQVSLDRPVAIKVLPENLGDDQQFRRRFMLEARAIALVSHTNVVQVYSAGTHQGNHYFAMEFVDGSDLQQKLRSGWRPAQGEALNLILQAAKGLAAAGERGLVHRDIKPGNMLLDQKNTLKLTDFGLVKLASENHGLTMAGVVMGTVSYFSPEQGRGLACDQRTDLYALGVVFYELLTGTLPFPGHEPTSVIYQHIHVDPPPPRTIDPFVPENWQRVCLTCLQKNPDDRYQNAAELIADLERLQRGEKPLCHNTKAPTATLGTAETIVVGQRFRGRRSWLLPVGLTAAVLAAATLSAITLWPTSPTPAAPLAAIPPPGSATPVPAQMTGTATPVPGQKPAPTQAQQPATQSPSEPNQPAEPPVPTQTQLSAQAKAAEAQQALTRCRAALAQGELAIAERELASAARLGDTADYVSAKEELRRQREAMINRIAEADALIAQRQAGRAVALLAPLAERHPHEPAVGSALRRATDANEREAVVARALAAQLDLGNQALSRRDWSAASAAFAAAKTIDPAALAVAQGLTSANAGQRRQSAAQAAFDTRIEAKDLRGGEIALTELQDAAPLATALAASDRLARLRQHVAVEHLATQEAAAQQAAAPPAPAAVAATPTRPPAVVETPAPTARPIPPSPTTTAATTKKPAPIWAANHGNDARGDWADLDLAGTVQRFRLIPAGTFTMGSPVEEKDRRKDEIQRQVTLSKAFWLADSECTQQCWTKVMGKNPSAFKGNDNAVNEVSFVEIQNFLAQAGTLAQGAALRLPSEAEWEYACRAGTTGPFAGAIDVLTWHRGNSNSKAQPVRTKAGNPWGLYDMHGGVLEWTQDAWTDTPAPDPVTDPLVMGKSKRVIRGGCWNMSAPLCRSAARRPMSEGDTWDVLGFRIAIDAAP